MKSKPTPGPRPRPWRVNYAVNYFDTPARLLYREHILAILKAVAWLRKIDCAISCGLASGGGDCCTTQSGTQETAPDLVYFRSTPQTEIFARQFRALIDGIFSEERYFLNNPVDIDSLPQRTLKDYPFPNED